MNFTLPFEINQLTTSRYLREIADADAKLAMFNNNGAMFSPQSQVSNKHDLKGKPKLRLLNKTSLHDRYNNRYTESKASSRMNSHIAKSYLENSNVHKRIARELMKSKPIADLKQKEDLIFKRTDRFNNNEYLKAVEGKKPKLKILTQDSIGQNNLNKSHILDAGNELLGNKRDIVSEIDYTDAKSAIENIKSSRHKRNASTTHSKLNRENLNKLDRESQKSKIHKGGGGSIYSDARSHISKIKETLKEISIHSKNQRNNKIVPDKLLSIEEVEDKSTINNSEEKMCNSCGGKLKQSEIDFYSQMVKFVSSKNNCDSPNPNETGSDLKEDENKKIAENERIEVEVPILCAKCVYNSYFKIKSLDTHPENSSSEVKILKRESKQMQKVHLI